MSVILMSVLWPVLSSLEGSRKIAENTCSVIDFDICFYCADVIDSHVDILSYEPSLSVSLSVRLPVSSMGLSPRHER